MNPHYKTEHYLELVEISEILYSLDGKIKYLKSRVDGSMKDPLIVLGRAKNHYRRRRARDEIFTNPKLFGEPAWDMLVDLFIAHEEGVRVSVSSLCIASCVPESTALRWIGVLETSDLVRRTPDATDSRRIYLTLTEKAVAQVRSYFEQHGS
jgi:DNA-binding MarR family transcriptional regulator